MSPNALKRARHVITENLRTVAAAEALIRHDLTELGRLMAEAHRSYSQDFEASCVECDAMVELAQDLPGPDRRAPHRAAVLAAARSTWSKPTHAPELCRGARANATRPGPESCPKSTFVMHRGARTGWMTRIQAVR